MLLARENHQHYREYEERVVKPRKVRKVRRFKSSSRLVYAAVLMVAFMVFLLLTTRYAQITATGYEIVDMKKQLKTMAAENQELEMKITKLQSLERIEVVAMAKFGMIKPDAAEGDQFIAVETKETPVKETVVAQQTINDNDNGLQSSDKKPMAVIDVLSKLLASWTGKVAQAEAGTVLE